jgi:hypothetical protein
MCIRIEIQKCDRSEFQVVGLNDLPRVELRRVTQSLATDSEGGVGVILVSQTRTKKIADMPLATYMGMFQAPRYAVSTRAFMGSKIVIVLLATAMICSGVTDGRRRLVPPKRIRSGLHERRGVQLKGATQSRARGARGNMNNTVVPNGGGRPL